MYMDIIDTNAEEFAALDAAVIMAEDARMSTVSVSRPLATRLRDYLRYRHYVKCGTVCVVLLPCQNGLIMIRRGGENDPGYMELGLPGGFQEGNISEPVRVTACRETREETGIVIQPEDLRVVNVETDEYQHNVIFFEHVGLPHPFHWYQEEVITFNPKEVAGVELILGPVSTAFPFHTEEVRRYFERQVK